MQNNNKAEIKGKMVSQIAHKNWEIVTTAQCNKEAYRLSPRGRIQVLFVACGYQWPEAGFFYSVKCHVHKFPRLSFPLTQNTGEQTAQINHVQNMTTTTQNIGRLLLLKLSP